MESKIILNSLTKDYGNHKGIFDVSFDVKEGEAFGFLGPNGAGKTTTIRHLMGFIKPEEGSSNIDGLNCWKDAPLIQKEVGYIPGEMSLFEDMTGEKFIKFMASYRGLKSLDYAYELIQKFELDPKGKIKKMSKGMKQKVGIVTAFMHNPKILILDEPTSGLDPLMQHRFIELIREETTKGKTILMSSHMFEEVEKTCHRVGIIRNGRLVTVNSVEELKKEQVQKYRITFVNEHATNVFTANEQFEMSDIRGNEVTIIIKNNLHILFKALGKYPVVRMTNENQSLEEVFMKYYGGSEND